MNYLSNLPFHLKLSFPTQPSSLLGSGSGGSSSLYLGGSDGTSLNFGCSGRKISAKNPFLEYCSSGSDPAFLCLYFLNKRGSILANGMIRKIRYIHMPPVGSPSRLNHSKMHYIFSAIWC